MAKVTKKKKSKSEDEDKPKKKKSKGGADTAYCMKCKEHVTPKKSAIVKTSNGRNMMKGKCPECGTTVVKFVA